MKTTMYALIINECYCGKNSIEKVYPNLYEAILGARDWLDDHFDDEPSLYKDLVEEFVSNDFLSIEGILDIDGFEIGI